MTTTAHWRPWYRAALRESARYVTVLPQATQGMTQNTNTGEFYFKESVLDQLPAYMRYAKRMRRADPDAYDLYSQLGAHILPTLRHTPSTDGLSAWWRNTLPTFGAVAWGVGADEAWEEKHHKEHPRFVYFHKMTKPPSEVERTNFGATYAVTVYWDIASGKHERKLGSAEDFFVAVDSRGVKVLRTLLREKQTIRHRDGSISHVPHQRWGVADSHKSWAAEHNQGAADFLRAIFIDAASNWEAANATMIRVTVKKDGIAAVFAVDPVRIPYFFSDRDVTLTTKRRKARIFRVVRPHVRTLPSGKVVPIKAHFAGLRSFTWNGYDVFISVPGYHHANLIDFTAGSIDEEFWEESGGVKKLTTTERLGASFAAHIREGWASPLPEKILRTRA